MTAAAPQDQDHDGPEQQDQCVLTDGTVYMGDRIRYRGNDVRNEGRLTVETETHDKERAPMNLALCGGYIMQPSSKALLKLYRHEVDTLMTMVADEQENADWETAVRQYKDDLADGTLRQCLYTHMRDDRDQIDRMSIPEIHAYVAAKADVPEVRAAVKEAEKTTGASPQGTFHRLFGRYRKTLRPLKSVTVVGEIGPHPTVPEVVQQRLAHSLSSQSSEQLAVILERLDRRAAEERKQLADVIAQALDRLNTSTKKESK